MAWPLLQTPLESLVEGKMERTHDLSGVPCYSLCSGTSLLISVLTPNTGTTRFYSAFIFDPQVEHQLFSSAHSTASLLHTGSLLSLLYVTHSTLVSLHNPQSSPHRHVTLQCLICMHPDQMCNGIGVCVFNIHKQYCAVNLTLFFFAETHFPSTPSFQIHL